VAECLPLVAVAAYEVPLGVPSGGYPAASLHTESENRASAESALRSTLRDELGDQVGQIDLRVSGGRGHRFLRLRLAADFRFRAAKDDYVLFLGRLHPDKGAHLAIDAARAAGRPIVLAGKLGDEVECTYFEAEIRPRLGAGAQFCRRGGHGGQARADGSGALPDVPHLLGGAVRYGDDRGDGLWHPRGRAQPRLGAGSDSGRGNRFRPGGPGGPVGGGRGGRRPRPAACRHHVEERFSAVTMAAAYERAYADRLAS
jgi:glycosyltransferase involved in cell wall biosynthesis